MTARSLMGQAATMRRRALRSLAALAMISALLIFSAPVPASAQGDERCFPETGFCISGRIRTYWEENGGLPVFGFPLSDQLTENDRTVQYFERQRFELHPENQAPYDVLLGRLGDEALRRQGIDWFTLPKAPGEQPGCRYFPETQHNVCDQSGGPTFLSYWSSNGLEFDGRAGKSYQESLALFGFPLSEPSEETNPDGDTVVTQWFERARFEWHPDNPAGSRVLLGRLGAETRAELNSYVLPGDAVFPEGVAYRPSTGDFFVSSTGDGTIFRGNVRQSVARPFLAPGGDGRSAATGLRIDDERGRLWVSGAATGQMFAYNLGDGSLIARFTTARTPTFINDVAVVPSGDAFFTDSQSPVLYRIFAGEDGQLAFEEWLDFTGTPLQYQQGSNVNGIVATGDGAYLVVVQSNTGKLFRIATATKEVVEVDLGGETVTNGDGIVLDGRTLYVVRNQQGLIVKIDMAEDFASGSVLGSSTDPSLAYPTTAAKAEERLLVVNSQFNRRGPNVQPELPFTVSSIPLP